MTTIDYKSTCESLRADLRDAGRKIASRDRLTTELQNRLDSMTEKANFFAARLPAVEAGIIWAAQQGYSFGQQCADEYCTGKGLEFVTDQAYYNLSKFQEIDEDDGTIAMLDREQYT